MSDAEPGQGDDEKHLRWLVVGIVICLFLALGVAGWHYRSTDKPAPACSNAEAHCGEGHDGTVQ